MDQGQWNDAIIARVGLSRVSHGEPIAVNPRIPPDGLGCEEGGFSLHAPPGTGITHSATHLHILLAQNSRDHI